MYDNFEVINLKDEERRLTKSNELNVKGEERMRIVFGDDTNKIKVKQKLQNNLLALKNKNQKNGTALKIRIQKRSVGNEEKHNNIFERRKQSYEEEKNTDLNVDFHLKQSIDNLSEFSNLDENNNHRKISQLNDNFESLTGIQTVLNNNSDRVAEYLDYYLKVNDRPQARKNPKAPPLEGFILNDMKKKKGINKSKKLAKLHKLQSTLLNTIDEEEVEYEEKRYSPIKEGRTMRKTPNQEEFKTSFGSFRSFEEELDQSLDFIERAEKGESGSTRIKSPTPKPSLQNRSPLQKKREKTDKTKENSTKTGQNQRLVALKAGGLNVIEIKRKEKSEMSRTSISGGDMGGYEERLKRSLMRKERREEKTRIPEDMHKEMKSLHSEISKLHKMNKLSRSEHCSLLKGNDSERIKTIYSGARKNSIPPHHQQSSDKTNSRFYKSTHLEPYSHSNRPHVSTPHQIPPHSANTNKLIQTPSLRNPNQKFTARSKSIQGRVHFNLSRDLFNTSLVQNKIHFQSNIPQSDLSASPLQDASVQNSGNFKRNCSQKMSVEFNPNLEFPPIKGEHDEKEKKSLQSENFVYSSLPAAQTHHSQAQSITKPFSQSQRHYSVTSSASASGVFQGSLGAPGSAGSQGTTHANSASSGSARAHVSTPHYKTYCKPPTQTLNKTSTVSFRNRHAVSVSENENSALNSSFTCFPNYQNLPYSLPDKKLKPISNPPLPKLNRISAKNKSILHTAKRIVVKESCGDSGKEQRFEISQKGGVVWGSSKLQGRRVNLNRQLENNLQNRKPLPKYSFQIGFQEHDDLQNK